jgi:hypothetical protein
MLLASQPINPRQYVMIRASTLGNPRFATLRVGLAPILSGFPLRREVFFLRLGFRPRGWFHHIFVGSACRVLSFLFRMMVSRSGIIFCIAHTCSTQKESSPVCFGFFPVDLIEENIWSATFGDRCRRVRSEGGLLSRQEFVVMTVDKFA